MQKSFLHKIYLKIESNIIEILFVKSDLAHFFIDSIAN